jgi:hypothetical protein
MDIFFTNRLLTIQDFDKQFDCITFIYSKILSTRHCILVQIFCLNLHLINLFAKLWLSKSFGVFYFTFLFLVEWWRWTTIDSHILLLNLNAYSYWDNVIETMSKYATNKGFHMLGQCYKQQNRRCVSLASLAFIFWKFQIVKDQLVPNIHIVSCWCLNQMS